jgi:hypothetical protein
MARTTRHLRTWLLVAAASLAACNGGSSSIVGAPTTTSPQDSPSASLPAVSPTPPAVPHHVKTLGPASSRCVHGWTTPPRTSPLFTDPLGIIRRTTGVQGPLVVVDLRYFTGPESPDGLSSGENAKGYLAIVQRWYIKLYARNDLSFQGRFLVESRRFGRGLSAVAPYDTKGYESPDWHGFQYDSGDTSARTYAGLPGTWSGVEYDFVKGGAGLDLPGLPNEVIGCLRGT